QVRKRSAFWKKILQACPQKTEARSTGLEQAFRVRVGPTFLSGMEPHPELRHEGRAFYSTLLAKISYHAILNKLLRLIAWDVKNQIYCVALRVDFSLDVFRSTTGKYGSILPHEVLDQLCGENAAAFEPRVLNEFFRNVPLQTKD